MISLAEEGELEMAEETVMGPLENLMVYIQENFTEDTISNGLRFLPDFVLTCGKHGIIHQCPSQNAPGMFDSFRVIARHIEGKHPELMEQMTTEEVPEGFQVVPKPEFGTCAVCAKTDIELTPKGRLKTHEVAAGKNCEGAGRKPKDA